MKRLSALKSEFEEIQTRVLKSREIGRKLESLDAIGFEVDVKKIEALQKDLDSVYEAEIELQNLINTIQECRESEKRNRQEAEVKNKEGERNEIQTWIYKTDNIINKAIEDATRDKHQLWLSALRIIQYDLHNFAREFEADELPYEAARTRMLELKEQAEVLSTPLPGEDNYYEILGVKRNASAEQIKRVYQKLIQIYHPDHGTHLGVDGDQRFRLIRKAYETLSDTNRRREYDATIGES